MINNKIRNISYYQAMNMLRNNDVTLIDVKTREEYKNFHLDNSINIPIDNFNTIAPKFLRNREQKIIVYCSSGIRSIAACEILKDRGFKNVYNIYGGCDFTEAR